MKKLFTLLLVLCLASLAGATTVSFVDEYDEIYVYRGEVVRLEVTSDAGLYTLDAIANVIGGDVITGATSTADCADYGWDPSLSFDPIGIGTSQAEIGIGTFGAPSSGVIAYFDILYTGEPSGWQFVYIGPGYSFGGSGDTNFQPPEFSGGFVTIIFIPEPATLALLGLGALALLRRRK